MRTRFRGRMILPVVLGLVAASAVSIPPAARAALISQSQEVQIGKQAAQQLEAQYGVVRDRKETDLVSQIGKRLAKVSSRPKLPWHFKVLNNSEINAVSLPGGYVYVFQGLMDAVKGDKQELAGVIAHEVGHVSARHQVEMMERQMAGSLLINLLFKGRVQDLAGLFTNIYALHFSRQDEYQADELGVKYAAAAGYDPYGLPHFLQLLESKSGSWSGQAAWLSTHPATETRIKRAFGYADDYASGGSGSR